MQVAEGNPPEFGFIQVGHRALVHALVLEIYSCIIMLFLQMTSLSWVMGLCLNLTLLRDRYCLSSMRLCGGKYYTAFSLRMLGSPARNAKGFYGIRGGDEKPLPAPPPPRAEVFRDPGLEPVDGFWKGLALLGEGEIDILF
jgi:hypothetical protein